MTTREEQAQFKSWLDEVIPYVPSGRVIPKHIEIPLSPGQAQAQRFWDFHKFLKAGQFASAAHVRREWIKHNPWMNGVEAAKNERLEAAYQEHIKSQSNQV